MRRASTLTAIADGVSDPGESVRLSLGSLPEALSPAGRAETVVSIFDGLVVRAGFVEESFAGRRGRHGQGAGRFVPGSWTGR